MTSCRVRKRKEGKEAGVKQNCGGMTNGGKGERKKGGWGNDCSNHKLQVDVLSGAAVNLCVHRSRRKPLKYWLQEGSHDMFTQKTNYPFLLRLSQSNQSESILR